MTAKVDNSPNRIKVFFCDCKHPEHQFIFSFDTWPATEKCPFDYDVALTVHLSKLPFLRRLKYSVKYLFGFQSQYGAFSEIMLNNSQLDRLESFINHVQFHIRKGTK